MVVDVVDVVDDDHGLVLSGVPRSATGTHTSTVLSLGVEDGDIFALRSHV